MSTLEERLAGGARKPWIPNPDRAAKYDGDSVQNNPLIGIFVDHETRTNFNQDGEYDVVVLEVEGVGEVAVHCQSTVLANQMHRARPVFGERVGVQYLGEVERQGAPNYSNYVVRVDRAMNGGAVRWADSPSDPDPVPAAPPPAAVASPVANSGATSAAMADDEIPFAPTIF
jgi:hypothetical protein